MPTAAQCSLAFNSFTIVWAHVFTSTGGIDTTGLRAFTSPTDEQIFHETFLKRDALKRYYAPPFDIFIQLDATGTSVVVKGRVHVQVAEYFGDTVCITYRLLVGNVPNFCTATRQLSTDELILLAGIPSSVERWSASQRAGAELTTLDAPVYRCEVTNLTLEEDGSSARVLQTLHGSNEVLRNVFNRHRDALITATKGHRNLSHELTHVVVDIWEDVDHARGESFAELSPEDVIDHIASQHRSELMGLLTLYPYEWPYRDERHFSRVCGENIAIDTDDLVFVGDNASVVIGTYGRRGADAPTNWKAVLTDRARDHVSWPGFLAILEVALAKLQKISEASLQVQSARLGDPVNGGNERQLRQNALMTLQVTRMMVDLNAVVWSRYQSHKLMSELAEAALNVPGEASNLLAAVQQVDNAMRRLDDIADARRARILNTLVAFITLASAFQVIFMHVRMPIVEHLINARAADRFGSVIILTVALILAGTVILAVTALIVKATRVVAKLFEKIRAALRTVNTMLLAARPSKRQKWR